MSTEQTNRNPNAFPLHLFYEGKNFDAQRFFGAHTEERDGIKKTVFRVWAPNAIDVSVVGDFNNWDRHANTMLPVADGVWEAALDQLPPYTIYKYSILTKSGDVLLKNDPYGTHFETAPQNATKLFESEYKWKDAKWLKKKAETNIYKSPMNIYEVHFDSWRTYEDGNPLSYVEFAKQIVPYMKELSYTHIEFMPLTEYPFDGSWGYQVCGYYAPTSRFGTPDDFRYFVNTLHAAGIGVILDWVPAHFPKDEHGLFEFDGHPLYEYTGKDRMEHKGWGTRCFDVGRPEVQSFLVSNALYWLREFHLDGLRIDAVASMLYLDYDRKPGEWIPNSYGENKNLEAIAFFRKLNTAIFGEFGDVLMIAEESTAWPMVTGPVDKGGLGFNFKWNMGWANDMFDYVSRDPLFRRYDHEKLTFPLMYAFSENYILPVSHDEVVHGKKSLLDKMFGGYEDKFACMRAFLVYMITLPGKKMTFMGTEFAPFREWDYQNQLEWFMLDYPAHAKMFEFTSALNNFYLQTPSLWQIDDGWDGFEWIDADLRDMNTITYRRKALDGSSVSVIINFSPVAHGHFRLKVPESGTYRIAFSSEDERFGGKGDMKKKSFKASKNESGGFYVDIDIPAYGGLILSDAKKKQVK